MIANVFVSPGAIVESEPIPNRSYPFVAAAVTVWQAKFSLTRPGLARTYVAEHPTSWDAHLLNLWRYS